MRYLALALLAILIACSPCNAPGNWGHPSYTSNPTKKDQNTIQIPYMVDRNFSPELHAQVMQAVEDWNTVLNGQFRFVQFEWDSKYHANEDEEVLIVRRVDFADLENKGVLGWFAPREPSVVNIVQGQPYVPVSKMSTVVMHEIGHWFGLGHFSTKGTLMYPAYTHQPPCIDFETVKEAADLHGWSFSNLNWCVL